ALVPFKLLDPGGDDLDEPDHTHPWQCFESWYSSHRSQSLPGHGTCHAGFERRPRVGRREERADPQRLIGAQVDDHREALLLLAAEVVAHVKGPAEQQRVFGELLDRADARVRAKAFADLAHPLAQAVVAPVVPALDAERDRVDLDIGIGDRDHGAGALAVPRIQPLLLVDHCTAAPTPRCHASAAASKVTNVPIQWTLSSR